MVDGRPFTTAGISTGVQALDSDLEPHMTMMRPQTDSTQRWLLPGRSHTSSLGSTSPPPGSPRPPAQPTQPAAPKPKPKPKPTAPAAGRAGKKPLPAAPKLGTIRRTNNSQDDAQNLSVERLYDHLMDEEHDFVGALDEFLSMHAEKERNKRQALYRAWTSDVFDHVQSQVDSAVSALSSQEVSDRGAKHMQDYIDVSNRKTYGVYRDIIIPAEYDPMSAHEHAIRYDNRCKHDPCKLELRKHRPLAASGAQPRGSYAAPVREGSDTRLSVEFWDKLESTPYGRLGCQRPLGGTPWSLHNRVTHNQFDIVRGDEILAREFPRGKRCDYPLAR